MSRRPSTFRQRDVTAAIKAAVAAGVQVGSVKVKPDGEIVVVIGKEPLPDSADLNEWDAFTEGGAQ